MPHALVTGGAGFIGSHLVDSLLGDQYRVTVLDNFDPFYERSIKLGNVAHHQTLRSWRLIEGDIRDPAVVNSVPDDVDLVVHLAAAAGVRPSIADPVRCQEINVAGTHNLLELARARGIRQFVFASSSSVYGVNPNVPWSEDDHVLRPISPYASTKISAELLGHVYAHLHGIRFLALRLFTVYGPRQRPDMGFHKFLKATIQGLPIAVYGDGEQTRDFTFVDDIAAASIAAAERGVPGRVYNIGGGSRVSLNHVLEMIGRVAGRQPVIAREDSQKGDMRHTYADTERARADLAFKPSTDLERGLAAEFAWLTGIL